MAGTNTLTAYSDTPVLSRRAFVAWPAGLLFVGTGGRNAEAQAAVGRQLNALDVNSREGIVLLGRPASGNTPALSFSMFNSPLSGDSISVVFGDPQGRNLHIVRLTDADRSAPSQIIGTMQNGRLNPLLFGSGPRIQELINGASARIAALDSTAAKAFVTIPADLSINAPIRLPAVGTRMEPPQGTYADMNTSQGRAHMYIYKAGPTSGDMVAAYAVDYALGNTPIKDARFDPQGHITNARLPERPDVLGKLRANEGLPIPSQAQLLQTAPAPR